MRLGQYDQLVRMPDGAGDAAAPVAVSTLEELLEAVRAGGGGGGGGGGGAEAAARAGGGAAAAGAPPYEWLPVDAQEGLVRLLAAGILRAPGRVKPALAHTERGEWPARGRGRGGEGAARGSRARAARAALHAPAAPASQSRDGPGPSVKPPRPRGPARLWREPFVAAAPAGLSAVDRGLRQLGISPDGGGGDGGGGSEGGGGGGGPPLAACEQQLDHTHVCVARTLLVLRALLLESRAQLLLLQSSFAAARADVAANISLLSRFPVRSRLGAPPPHALALGRAAGRAAAAWGELAQCSGFVV
jgi:hypothetical protein